MPYIAFLDIVAKRYELDSEHILVSLQDLGNYDLNGKVFLDNLTIQLESTHCMELAIKALLPGVEVLVITIRLYLLFDVKELLTIFEAERTHLVLEIGEEVDDGLSRLGHLDLGLIVSPSVVAKQRCEFAPDVENLVEDWRVVREALLLRLPHPATRFGALGPAHL